MHFALAGPPPFPLSDSVRAPAQYHVARARTPSEFQVLSTLMREATARRVCLGREPAAVAAAAAAAVAAVVVAAASLSAESPRARTAGRVLGPHSLA